MNEVTQSIAVECNQRLEVLYNKHHKWLGAVAFNISHNQETTQELVSDLYLYLAEKCNPKLFYLDSFNLQYCRQFILSRFINGIKRDNKKKRLSDDYDEVDIEYDYENDERIDKAYDEVKEELHNMKNRKGWSSAMIYEHYWFSDKTLDEVSKDIRISKSTVFLAVKKVKKHLKNNIQNPFNND
jgi:RNA polymerase sigma factor (sigma-70 family)